MMGNASKQMQKQILEHYLEELALVIHNLQAQLPEKQRLFRVLGFWRGISRYSIALIKEEECGSQYYF